ncbi:MAG: penicillin-binding protein [Alphaproteobacteria bacterium]|nr:penicillin-binding protein [Alphaproteobacteria bacterium]
MAIKEQLRFRAILFFILICSLFILVIGRAVYIQQFQGKIWTTISDSIHLKIQDIIAERGNIYSEDGELLSTSIPEYDIYMDLNVDYLRNQNGRQFWEHLDSLSLQLSKLFPEKQPLEYRKILIQAFKKKNKYLKLLSNVSYLDFLKLKQFKLFKLGRYRSGLIAVEQPKRIYPLQLLARRTLGIFRDNNSVGLESSYDSILRGHNGKRMVRLIAGGATLPVNYEDQVEPEIGKDIITTIDSYIQEVSENALLDVMKWNEAEEGCVIVMETHTGKIKAIANLEKQVNGNYDEVLNFALRRTEPGSTFKLFSLLALLEDGSIDINSSVNIEKGKAVVNGIEVHDSEEHDKEVVTVKQAFELSSNVGFAKLISQNFKNNPQIYYNMLSKSRFDSTSGIDLRGESKPFIIKPNTKHYNNGTLVTMSYGYAIGTTPLQIIEFYNAIANHGIMVKPYLVSAIAEEGKIIKTMQPTILNNQLTSTQIIKKLQLCLEGVVENGTAKELFKNFIVPVAGKTGTAKISAGSQGYINQYFSSFAGYFPADNPQYTCFVWVKNKIDAKQFYGIKVAGPVFKTIVEKLYLNNRLHLNPKVPNFEKDSNLSKSKNYYDITNFVTSFLPNQFIVKDKQVSDWVQLKFKKNKVDIEPSLIYESKRMPVLYDYSLKDALSICEELGLHVKIKGHGKLINQSIRPDEIMVPGQQIILEFN